VNFEEVAMSEYDDYHTYQYIDTLTDAAVYSCDVTRSSMKQESYCGQLGVGTAFTDGIIIGEYQYNNIHSTTMIRKSVDSAHRANRHVYYVCTCKMHTDMLELQL
jgi:hypothetical protein